MVVVWLWHLRLSELIEKLLCRYASLFACLDESTFQTVEKQDCSAMLNQISSATNEQFTNAKCQFNDLLQIPQKRELVIG
jgi:hypothetical protein